MLFTSKFQALNCPCQAPLGRRWQVRLCRCSARGEQKIPKPWGSKGGPCSCPLPAVLCWEFPGCCCQLQQELVGILHWDLDSCRALLLAGLVAPGPWWLQGLSHQFTPDDSSSRITNSHLMAPGTESPVHVPVMAPVTESPIHI